MTLTESLHATPEQVREAMGRSNELYITTVQNVNTFSKTARAEARKKHLARMREYKRLLAVLKAEAPEESRGAVGEAKEIETN